MREYKGIVDSEHITVHLTEKQMWGLIKRFDPYSSYWKTKNGYKQGQRCLLCEQYNLKCYQCPLGHGMRGSAFCVKILQTISPTVVRVIEYSWFDLNKDGSVPKRIEAAFKKVQVVLLAGKKVVRRPKEKP